jgi:hypothetical protein
MAISSWRDRFTFRSRRIIAELASLAWPPVSAKSAPSCGLTLTNRLFWILDAATIAACAFQPAPSAQYALWRILNR